VPTVYHALNHRRSRFAGPDVRRWGPTRVAADGTREPVAFDALPDLDFIKPRHWERARARK
jgi:hypothetical protein